MVSAPQRGRPLGVTIICIIVAIFGILDLLSGIYGLANADGNSSLTTVGIVVLIQGLIFLVVAWGLWTLRRWAYWVAIVWSVLSLLEALFSFFSTNSVAALLFIIFPLVILIYLLADRNARAAFTG